MSCQSNCHEAHDHSRGLSAEPGGAPAPAAVDAHVDPFDRAEPRPGASAQVAGTDFQQPIAGREVGDPGRDHQRAREHPRDRLPRVVGRLAEAIAAGLLVALEGLVEDGDPIEPLDAGHPVPAGHDQAQREAVLGRQRLAVHRVGDQHLVAKRLGQRQAALVLLHLAALEAPIETPEEHLHRLPLEPRLVEQAAQRDAGPLGVPDRLQQPRLAERAGREPGAPVAGALQGHGEGRRRQRAQLRERQRELALDPAADPESPIALVDHRDVVVDQQVVQAGRRQVIGHGLEREAVVAGGEPQLLRMKPLGSLDARKPRGDACRFGVRAASLDRDEHIGWAERARPQITRRRTRHQDGIQLVDIGAPGSRAQGPGGDKRRAPRERQGSPQAGRP